jgi:hypothetical protein
VIIWQRPFLLLVEAKRLAQDLRGLSLAIQRRLDGGYVESNQGIVADKRRTVP